MTQEELNYIKDAFSQILDDIGGNPDWYDAAKAVASDLGTMEKQLEERVTKLPSNLDEAAEDSWAVYEYRESPKGLYSTCYVDGFKAGAKWLARQGWISVDESLPKMAQEVIVLTDEIGTAPIYKINFGHIVDVNRCIDYNGWNIPGVKYWMPCPKIPGMND